VWKGAENSSLPGFDPRTVYPVMTIPTTLSRPLLLLLVVIVVVAVVALVEELYSNAVSKKNYMVSKDRLIDE
jgi:hypothetical protein